MKKVRHNVLGPPALPVNCARHQGVAAVSADPRVSMRPQGQGVKGCWGRVMVLRTNLLGLLGLLGLVADGSRGGGLLLLELVCGGWRSGGGEPAAFCHDFKRAGEASTSSDVTETAIRGV